MQEVRQPGEGMNGSRGMKGAERTELNTSPASPCVSRKYNSCAGRFCPLYRTGEEKMARRPVRVRSFGILLYFLGMFLAGSL